MVLENGRLAIADEILLLILSVSRKAIFSSDRSVSICLVRSIKNWRSKLDSSEKIDPDIFFVTIAIRSNSNSKCWL